MPGGLKGWRGPVTLATETHAKADRALAEKHIETALKELGRDTALSTKRLSIVALACEGCGECVEHCENEALSVIEGKATVEFWAESAASSAAIALPTVRGWQSAWSEEVRGVRSHS